MAGLWSKDKIMQYNSISELDSQINSLSQAGNVCGEDFFAYVEFEIILNLFGAKELEKFNRYIYRCTELMIN